MTFVDYHNGPNLGLEPTTPGQARGEYLHYAREVAELRAEIERKDAEVARMRRQLEWTEAYARDTLATNSRDMDDWRGDVEHIANSARALLARYGRQQAESAEPAAQAPAADAHLGYAGVTVWVGDMECTMAVPKQILKASRYDALLECFQKARHAIDAAMQRTTARETSND